MPQGGGLEETVVKGKPANPKGLSSHLRASTHLITNLFSYLPTRCIHYTKVKGVMTLGSFLLFQ
jgi:hypothetical protein